MNRYKNYFILISFISFVASSRAQEATKKWYLTNNQAELALSGGDKEFSISLNVHHLHGMGKKKNFKLGYGLRASTYFGEDKNYVTAPAKLTSGETGPQAMFTENIEANFDTVYIKYPQVNMLNLFVIIEYTVFKKIDLGFNIDVIGFSFGGKQDGGYFSSKNPIALYTANQVASPTPLNLLLISDNDIGSLNSEFYIRYRFNDHWGIKGGFTFMFTEYTTENKLRLDNDRFRYKSGMGMLGLSYKF